MSAYQTVGVLSLAQVTSKSPSSLYATHVSGRSCPFRRIGLHVAATRMQFIAVATVSQVPPLDVFLMWASQRTAWQLNARWAVWPGAEYHDPVLVTKDVRLLHSNGRWTDHSEGINCSARRCLCSLYPSSATVYTARAASTQLLAHFCPGRQQSIRKGLGLQAEGNKSLHPCASRARTHRLVVERWLVHRLHSWHPLHHKRADELGKWPHPSS